MQWNRVRTWKFENALGISFWLVSEGNILPGNVSLSNAYEARNIGGSAK